MSTRVSKQEFGVAVPSTEQGQLEPAVRTCFADSGESDERNVRRGGDSQRLLLVSVRVRLPRAGRPQDQSVDR